MSEYPLGQPVRLSVTIKDITGTLVNPGTLTLTIKKPDATQQVYSSPVNDSTGQYHQDVPATDLTQTGAYEYVWTSTGTGAGAVPGGFDVYDGLAPVASTYYCTVQELKARLNITTTTDDLLVELAVASASRAVDGYCERFFYKQTVTRTYVPYSLYETRVDDLVSVSGLATDPGGTGTFSVTWATGDYQLLPYNPGKLGEQWPYTCIRAVGHFTFPWVTPLVLMRMDRVQVTGVFGWPAIPEAVHTATLIAAAELYRLKDMPVGGDVPGEFAVAVIADNPDMGKLLYPYRKNAWLAA